MSRFNKEKEKDEKGGKGFWSRFREALQSPPGRFLCTLLGTAAVGGVAYAAGRKNGREKYRNSYY